MKTERQETSGQKNSEWLSPTDALTRFRAMDTAGGGATFDTHLESQFGFRIGSLGFLVPLGTYCEVIEQIQVNPLPNVKPWLGGLLNLRGNLVPVIDLRWVLGEEAVDSKKQRLFAIGQGEKAVALWIDSLPETQHLTVQPLQQLPSLPDALQRWVSNGYLQDGQIWLNVQYDELFKSLGRIYAT